ncbi:hypothetical protein CFV33872_09940 [Campylobacter fetus subsp. venerealis CCUG 33872]|uniref:EexN family lipoprotein n=1 Tax=Campylobacter fetus TaxID=196 RepID=UPI00080B1910|nr:EexN family lipoprotein [Campylobacter fetus]KAA3682675.1 hypothetical protein E3U40_09950 [Campylobacter fetus subsp. venerealis]OCS23449.1 hypothetical protein CFVI9825_09085 [Campylobacter fetus subsp. venerealis cfvi9825]OCS25418.1 hypothetical protein CFV33872_09940 [Campylobacter fetus subsp. venerealis CCUG 33872]
MKNIIFGAIATTILLSGCNKQEAKTKEYYDQHLEEAELRMQECKKLEKFNEIEQLDCQNANSAIQLAPDSRVPYGKGKTTTNPEAFKF